MYIYVHTINHTGTGTNHKYVHLLVIYSQVNCK